MQFNVDDIPEKAVDSLRKAALLIAKEKIDELTLTERNELEEWLNKDPRHREWLTALSDNNYLAEEIQAYERSKQISLSALEDMREKGLIPRDIEKPPSEIQMPAVPGRRHFLKTAWVWYAAAAIIILAIGAYLWNYNLKVNTENSKIVQHHPLRRDVAPPNAVLATITLSNGKTIALDSADTGTLASEGNVTIERTADGKIVYKGLAPGQTLFNTISLPRGSRISSLILSDGTEVFLNTASSLKYPVAFNGKDRRVEMTGEAYFDVAKNKEKPFVVRVGTIMSVEVLGTAMNISSYADEDDIKTTLVEGAVKVINRETEKMLQPGQQAALGKLYQSQFRIAEVNTDEIIAWKNGYFNMPSVDINTVMRSISRWYDVDVDVRRQIPGKFTVDISRNTPLSDVLKILEETGELKTEIRGRTVIIK
jgi:ferric-dicitrate binding protein FerR (iron transport regulator)